MRDQKISDEMTRSLQIAMGSAQQAGDKQKPETLLRELCDQYLKVLPRKFDLEIAQAKYPHDYKNSYNTVFL